MKCYRDITHHSGYGNKYINFTAMNYEVLGYSSEYFCLTLTHLASGMKDKSSHSITTSSARGFFLFL